MRTTKEEAERLSALKRYEILDTPKDACYDHLTDIASRLFHMPYVLISFVDEERIWFKAKYGLEDVTQIPREPGLCASAILSNEPYLVQNARYDSCTMANRWVSGDLGLQFYAAAPLKTPDGFNIGTFCLLDKKPRYLNSEQLNILKEFAKTVVDEMEIRLRAQEERRTQQQRITELETLLSSRGGRGQA